MERMTAQELLEEYFGAVKFYTLKPAYKCSCSRNYIEGILAAMGEKELRSILEEQGEISVYCHYCNTDYKFSAQEVEELITRMRGDT